LNENRRIRNINTSLVSPSKILELMDAENIAISNSIYTSGYFTRKVNK